MYLYIMIRIIGIHDVREHYTRVVTAFFQLDVAGKFGGNLLIMVQSVFQIGISVGFHKIVQGMDTVSGDGVSFACSNKDDLAFRIFLDDLAGKLYA